MKNEKMLYFLVNEETDVIEKISKQRGRIEKMMDILNDDISNPPKYMYRGFNVNKYPQVLDLRAGDNMKKFFIEVLKEFYY